jgi:mono/diheme cytochrome c family protein
MQLRRWQVTPRVFLWCLGVGLLGWALFHYWTNTESAHLAPSAAAHGKYVYENQCAACHEAKDLHLVKQPPKLDGLFQRDTLPSGQPLTEQAVRNVILHGRGIMPPFQQSLSEQDVDDLIEYLRTR